MSATDHHINQSFWPGVIPVLVSLAVMPMSLVGAILYFYVLSRWTIRLSSLKFEKQ
ncbi:hypothetical protein D3C73_1499280 [compost metagenome]